MSCQNHPNKESVANCQFCGKELCEDCAINIAGKNYCEECMSDLVGPELTSIASKTPDSETQDTSIPKQDVSTPKDTYDNQEQTPVQKGSENTIQKETPIEQTQTPKIEETNPIDQITREPQRIKEEIPPQNQNINRDNDDFNKNLNNNLNDNNNLNENLNNNLNNNLNHNNNNPYRPHDDIYSDDRLYNDINGNNNSSKPQYDNKIEEKYEKYLDDLYFDDNPENQKNTRHGENRSGENFRDNRNIGANKVQNVSLSEQLAKDEAEHGSITKEPFVPDVPEEPVQTEKFTNSGINNNEDRNRNVPIMENLRSVKSDTPNKENPREYTHSTLHRGNIHYKKEEKKPFSSLEKVLTVLLVILIILVVLYIVYLLTLNGQYPSFISALGAFIGNPGEVLGQMFS